MTGQTALVKALNDGLKPLGFKRRGNNWFRIIYDLYSIVNIQRSRWGDSLFVNVAFTPAELLDDIWMPERNCMMRFRAERLNDVDPEYVHLLQEDLPAGMKEAEFDILLREKIVGPLVGTLEDASSVHSLKMILKSRVSGNVFIHRELQAILNADTSDDNLLNPS
jgi:hypothetical protein